MDAVCIAAVCVATAAVAEVVSWATVFRGGEYKALKRRLDRHSRRLELKLAQPDNGKSQHLHRKLQTTRTKPTMAVGVALMLTFLLLNHMYDGRVVGTLPYEPVSWLSGRFL